MIRHRMPCEGGDEQPGAISSNLTCISKAGTSVPLATARCTKPSLTHSGGIG